MDNNLPKVKKTFYSVVVKRVFDVIFSGLGSFTNSVHRLHIGIDFSWTTNYLLYKTPRKRRKNF